MRITFLGTGDAGGVPCHGCDCTACKSARAVADYRRRPCCALIESGTTRILIDAGLTDLTERFPPGSLTAIVLTHFHPDHVQGLFHLRWGVGASIPVFGPPDSEGCADLYKNHGLLEFHRLAKFESMKLGDIRIIPLPLIHSKVTFGYAIEDCHGARFAYMTDTVGLPPRTEEFLMEWGPHGLAIDCSHPPQTEPKNHNDWILALGLIDRVKPRRAWLTHISHTLDAWLLDTSPPLALDIHVARDNVVIDVGTQEA
ncbi:MAG: phosphonate metabolism protein PhnP [Betaproteobacteria bacterium HGW-Betaproteobacteria-11]|nr:MAG: phosphonate metabolism protein PhnP [Betaproteobacteria bacterium HGW-Betaproteobacteria-11]